MKKIILIAIFAVSVFANGIIIKDSKHSVDQTMENIKEILTKKGVNIFNVIDHKSNATKANLKMREAQLIIFGNPKLGTRLMNANIVSGLDLPLNILVYKDVDGKVKLAYRDGSWLKSQHDLKLDKLTSKMSNILDNITNKAIQ